MLDVKQVVRLAIEFVKDMYEREGVIDLRLEEVERSEDRWSVTLSFARPDPSPIAAVRTLSGSPRWRDYKTLIVNGADGTIESMKIRELESLKAQ
jgi:hypothetical protein